MSAPSLRAALRNCPRHAALLLGAFAAIGSVSAQKAPPVAETSATTAPKLRLDTAAYRSAVALASGKASTEPVPTEGGARTALLNERGLWLLRLEQWKLAEQDFFAVLQKEPKNVTARAGVAWAGLKTGRVEAAKSRLDELQQEFPDAFAVASESDEIRAAALGRVADHVFWRQQRGSLVADDVAESPYNFGAFQLDALLEDAESALENGSIDLAEEHLQAVAALGAPDLPALRRLRSQIAAARTEIAQLEPGAPDFASTRFLVEKRVAQAQRLAGTSEVKAGQSNAFLATRSTAFALATTELGRPTINARRRLLARWLALRAGAEKPTELEFVRDDLSLSARFFASTPNEGDTASATLAAENLARLRQIAPNWPLSEVVFLPTAWPDGPLLKVIEEITGGAPLTPGDPRLKKAIELWQTQLEPFSVDNALDTPEDALRLGDHYRIGAALAQFELLTLPEGAARLSEYGTLGFTQAVFEQKLYAKGDTAQRAELSARIEHFVRLSNLCVDYAPSVARGADTATAADVDLAGRLHAHFNGWMPAHRSTPKAKELEPVFTQLSAQAWVVREYLRGEAHQADVLPWRQVRRTLEARYASYVSPTQIHDRPLLFVVAQLRRKAGDLAGTLDVLPLLEQRTQLGTEVENLQVPAKPDAAVYETELSAFVRSLRGASPAATAYADITAWLEAAKQTPGKAGPLPAVAPEFLAIPAVATQWAWANIVSGRTTDPWEHLRLAEKAAKDSASFGLLAPELMLHAIRNGTAALYERARRVWSYAGAHLEEFDETSLRQQREACNNLMGRLLDLRSGQYLKTLKGDGLLDFKLAYAAGDFDAAGNTRAGQRSERFILHSTRAELMAHEGLQAFYSGDASLARTKLVYALELEKVADPDYPGLGAFGGVADGEYVLMLRALVGYVDLRTAERKQGRVVMEFLTKAIALAKLPGHADSYRALEEEFKWRTTYVDNAADGRRAIAQYLSKLLFQNGPRNAVFERAHFLDSSLVDGLVYKRQGVALGWLQSGMINDLPLPPKWDGHRVINERYENPNYAINKRKYFDAIVSRDYQAALALDDTPRMIERHLEYNVAEPEFWGYYRALLRTLRWR